MAHLFKKLIIKLRRQFTQPSRARVNKLLRKDNQIGICTNKFFEGMEGHGRF